MTKKKQAIPENTVLKEQVQLSESAETSLDYTFPIVGIGASAGGLAAFEAFFSSIPADKDTGMAFILVQHLAPDHKSILTELVRRYTRMQVFEVTDGLEVKPNCTYIIPPNRDMAFLNGRLQLLEMSTPRGQRLPIDFFFRSLAQDLREKAICIVLSGTGSDGTLGIRAVKGEGGMVMVQKPESTEYDGMPQSAIATGLVDYILTPAQMPEQLIAYVKHSFSKVPQVNSAEYIKGLSTINKICVLLRAKTNHDFSLYKPNTLFRRIERRMAVHQIESMEEYVKYLQNEPNEPDALFRDLLIGVTNFFRDPEAFEELQKRVIPHLFEAKRAGKIVRVWVPGCSTGEEAYSIAIILQEHMEKLQQSFAIQVFATDIDKKAIETARAGVYPASIADDILPDRLAKYFTYDPESTTFRIHKGIRDLLVFSEQDVIKDPPFSKLDLISCRNLMIYLEAQLQRKLIPLFHYALISEGWLFLGTSESVGEFGDLFNVIDRKSKLFQKKVEILTTRRPFVGSIIPYMMDERDTAKNGKRVVSQNKTNLREVAEKAILQQYNPSGILVNERGDILYLYGRTGMYLEPAPGEINMNVLEMARDGLRRELTTTLHQSVSRKETLTRQGLRVKTNGHYTTVNLTVRPVTTENIGQEVAFSADKTIESVITLYMVVLEEVAETSQGQAVGAPGKEYTDMQYSGDSALDSKIIALNQELQAKDEYLQSAIEELETSNEELKASNEEMQSVNEELQSTNEELETSKEELQSLNEELATVNNELQTKVADLSRLNNDMNNLLSGTGIGTVFVDHQLRILRFTPTVTKMMNLIQTDIGRPVNHIVSNLIGYQQLTEDVQEVLETLIPKEIEVQLKDGAWYILRIMPYRTIENMIEGAVITFVDITERKKVEGIILDLNRNLEERIKQGIVEIREKDHILMIQSRQAAMGEMISNIAHQWRQPLNNLGILIQSTSSAYKSSMMNEEYLQKFISDGMNLISYMSQTIDDFRYFFKPEKEKKMFPAESVIRKTCALVEPGLIIEKIKLTIQVKQACEIFGFSNEFGQVLLNLLQNAKEALLSQKIPNPEIIIEVNKIDGKAAIKIIDNAGGIPAKVQDKVFEPYFTTKNNGTGIGLYMSKMIIEKNMNGKLLLENKNDGAVFTIII